MLWLECINFKSLISLQICDSFQTAHIRLRGFSNLDQTVGFIRNPSTLLSGSRLRPMQRVVAAMPRRNFVGWRTFMCQGLLVNFNEFEVSDKLFN